MSRARGASSRWMVLLGFIGAVACSDGSGKPTNTGSASGGTLAYVMNECSTDPMLSGVLNQTLYVRRAGRTPQPVQSLTIQVPPCRCGEFPQGGWDCLLSGVGGFGQGLVPVGAFQRLGVSPDGQSVVFEVWDAPGLERDDPEQATGIFVVPADGSAAARRIGPASREPAWTYTSTSAGGDTDGLCVEACREQLVAADTISVTLPFFRFSPDGSRVVYTDQPKEDGVTQVVTLSLTGASRRPLQVSHLEKLNPAFVYYPSVASPSFADDSTVAFATAEMLTSGPEVRVHRVAADGSGEITTQPAPEPIPGAVAAPTFTITEDLNTVFSVFVPETPSDVPCDFPVSALDIFVSNGENVLQLTNYQRSDTGTEMGMLTPIVFEDRVYFTASVPNLPRAPSPAAVTTVSATPNAAADRKSNPTQDCQIFSLPVLGGTDDLRQLTQFKDPLGSEDDPCVDVDDAACDDSCCNSFGPGSQNSCCADVYGEDSPLCEQCQRDECIKKCECRRKGGCLVFVTGCHSQLFGIDRKQRKLIFHSSCDPLSRCDATGQCNRTGQIYAVGIDDGEIEQLVQARGFATGSNVIELPGPYAYGGP